VTRRDPTTPERHPHASHRSPAGADRRSLAAVLAIGIAILAAEALGALLTGSLALAADAGHVLADVVVVVLALGAIRLADRPATQGRTFGWYRAEVLVALLNAVLLLGLVAWLVVEAWRRLEDPHPIAAAPMMAIGVLGALGNLVSLRLLRGPGRRSLAMRSAYLEVLGDLLASIAVVVAALVVGLTGVTIADTVASLVIAVLIVPRAWSLLRESLDVLLEATPRGLRLEEVRRHLLQAEGVEDVHDLHAWTITSGQPVISAHVVLAPRADPGQVLDEVCRCLAGDFDLDHSTIQLETSDRRRLEETTHA
jgi:cobalt-zinc-cadmium efflux system protein